MPPQTKYFIGHTPAKDVPSPPGGWEEFRPDNPNRIAIIQILATVYRDAVIENKLPEPHTFFNSHNSICRNFNSRHFSEFYKVAVAEALELIGEDSDVDTFPSSHTPSKKSPVRGRSSAGRSPTRRSNTSRAKTATKTPAPTNLPTNQDPPETPQLPKMTNYIPLQTNQAMENASPDQQIHYTADRFKVGRLVTRHVIEVDSHTTRDNVSIKFDDATETRWVLKVLGRTLNDEEAVQGLYTGGMWTIEGGHHDGQRVLLQGDEACVIAHSDHRRVNSNQGGMLHNGVPHLYQVFESDEPVNKMVKFEILRHVTGRKLLILDVISKRATVEEFVNFSQSPMDITKSLLPRGFYQGHHGGGGGPGGGGGGGGLGPGGPPYNGGGGGGLGPGGHGGGGYNPPPPPPPHQTPHQPGHGYGHRGGVYPQAAAGGGGGGGGISPPRPRTPPPPPSYGHKPPPPPQSRNATYQTQQGGAQQHASSQTQYQYVPPTSTSTTTTTTTSHDQQHLSEQQQHQQNLYNDQRYDGQQQQRPSPFRETAPAPFARYSSEPATSFGALAAASTSPMRPTPALQATTSYSSDFNPPATGAYRDPATSTARYGYGGISFGDNLGDHGSKYTSEATANTFALPKYDDGGNKQAKIKPDDMSLKFEDMSLGSSIGYSKASDSQNGQDP